MDEIVYTNELRERNFIRRGKIQDAKAVRYNLTY